MLEGLHDVTDFVIRLERRKGRHRGREPVRGVTPTGGLLRPLDAAHDLAQDTELPAHLPQTPVDDRTAPDTAG